MICLALVMGLGMCAAAGKPAQKKEVTTVFVTDIDCEHCVKKIMNNVPSLGKGIKDVKVDLPKKEVTVIYDASKNNDENIVKGFATIKVKAGDQRPQAAGPPGRQQPRFASFAPQGLTPHPFHQPRGEACGQFRGRNLPDCAAYRITLFHSSRRLPVHIVFSGFGGAAP